MGVFGSGSTAGVIVRIEDNRQRLLLGESLNGWTLEAVHPDRVDFSRNARQATLVLEQGTVAAAPVKAGSSRARGSERKQRPGATARAQRRQAQQQEQEQPPRSENKAPRGKDNDNNGAPPARLGFGR